MIVEYLMIKTVAEESIRVYLPKEKKLRFKAACVVQDRDMSDVVNEMIDKWLEENGMPAKQEKWRGREEDASKLILLFLLFIVI